MATMQARDRSGPRRPGARRTGLRPGSVSFARLTRPPLSIKGASHLLTQTALRAALDPEPPAACGAGLNGGGQTATARTAGERKHGRSPAL